MVGLKLTNEQKHNCISLMQKSDIEGYEYLQNLYVQYKEVLQLLGYLKQLYLIVSVAQNSDYCKKSVVYCDIINLYQQMRDNLLDELDLTNLYYLGVE